MSSAKHLVLFNSCALSNHLKFLFLATYYMYFWDMISYFDLIHTFHAYIVKLLNQAD